MRFPPIEVLMTWPKPNYVDPVTRGGAAVPITIVFLALAFLVTCLRLYTRLRITCSFGLDDVLIIIAFLLAVGMGVVIALATDQYGWTRHMWDVPMNLLSTATKLNLIFQILFSLCSSITKLSVLWFCKRLIGAGSKGLYRTYNIVLIASMIFVTICCVVFVLVSIFQCTPIHAYWDLETPYPHHCLNDGAAVFSASVVNIFTDFLTTVVPFPLIWNLKLPTRQRIALMIIFGFGIVVNIAGSIRTAYVWKSMVTSYDITWLGWPLLIAATVEINLGLICASAPALRPLVSSFLPRLLQSTREYAYGSKRRSRSFKIWNSTGPSAPSKDSELGETETQLRTKEEEARFEVMRTVEMQTWSESRTPVHAISDYDLPAQNTRVQTPIDSIELKDGVTTYTTPGSHKSSGSIPRTGDSPYSHRNPSA